MNTISSALYSLVNRSLFILIVAVNWPALAQDASDSAASVQASQNSIESGAQATAGSSIEEIRVTADQSFFLLNSQIKYAKERLYSVYNDLNEVEEFDVNCRNSDWTGTHIQYQECWPRFFAEIVAANTQDSQFGFDVLMSVRQLRNMHQEKFDALRANIARVATENPPAAEALLELGKLEKALATKKELCKEQPAFLFVFRLCGSAGTED